LGGVLFQHSVVNHNHTQLYFIDFHIMYECLYVCMFNRYFGCQFCQTSTSLSNSHGSLKADADRILNRRAAATADVLVLLLPTTRQTDRRTPDRSIRACRHSTSAGWQLIPYHTRASSGSGEANCELLFARLLLLLKELICNNYKLLRH